MNWSAPTRLTPNKIMHVDYKIVEPICSGIGHCSPKFNVYSNRHLIFYASLRTEPEHLVTAYVNANYVVADACLGVDLCLTNTLVANALKQGIHGQGLQHRVHCSSYC